MGLGENTKCDLSAGIAKLDIETLTIQTERHFYSLVRKMNKKTSEVLNNSLTPKDRKETVSSMSCYGSKELVQIATDIAEVAELLHTLQEKEGREIQIV